MKLTKEQQERLDERLAKNNTQEEFQKFIEEEGIKLDDEDLDMISGGRGFGRPRWW